MNVFELVASISLDTSEYDKELDKSSKKTSTFGDVLKANLASDAIASGISKIGGAIKFVAGKTADLTKESINQYGSYEQLVGGVETLFGAGGASLDEYAASVGKSVEEAKAEYEALLAAQQTVMENADQAYKTAGLSANQYMEQATGTAAAMVSSLGGDTQKAADMVDMAVTDMADNANKMGSDITSIQNAYGGFAKQNFTMLDNLKLGYGGTKEEMQRLLDTANELNAQQGKATDYQIGSYADIVEAIHVVQTEMGITGTTAKEASDTIQGSIATMKSAWTNWLTALGDENADLGKKTDELVESVETTLKNLIPVVGRILTSIGGVLEEKGPDIIAELSEGLISAIPDLLTTAAKLAAALAKGLLKGIAGLGKKLISSIFGGGDEEVSVEPASKKVGSYKKGLYRVPFDDFPAYLHRNEAVLTAQEADDWRNNRRTGVTNITNNYYATVDAKNVREFNDVVNIMENQRIATRMGVR